MLSGHSMSWGNLVAFPRFSVAFGYCSMAEIHITKLAAAQRQLQAAIRMFFAKEDDLAVHTVASAAYRLISDLQKSRGRDEVDEYYKTSVFYLVRDYRRGTLPKYLSDDAEAMNYVRELAEALPLIAKTTAYEDISVRVDPELAKRFWKRRNKVFNFLKHADKDAGKQISMTEVDNYTLLLQANASFARVGVDLGTEGFVLWLYSVVRDGEYEALPDSYRSTSDIGRLSNDEQLTFFSDFMTELKS